MANDNLGLALHELQQVRTYKNGFIGKDARFEETTERLILAIEYLLDEVNWLGGEVERLIRQ